jgi:hypothetical protein
VSRSIQGSYVAQPKCTSYLRDVGFTIGTYRRWHWRQIAAWYVLYATVIAVAFHSGHYYTVIGVLCFWAGRTTRDLQWQLAFVRGWPITVELMDWDKVLRLAGPKERPQLREGI